MSKTQKRLIAVALIILLLIIALMFVIWWQKKKWQEELERVDINKERVINRDGEDEANKREIIKEATPTDMKRGIIEELVPGSDLAEFDLPGEIINKNYLSDKFVSPAYNRSGLIKRVIYPQHRFIFVDDSLGKEKEYTVIVNDNTKISIDIVEDVFANEQAEYPLETKRYSREGSFDELQAGDSIRVRSSEIIRGGSFVAEEIVVGRKIVTFKNKE